MGKLGPRPNSVSPWRGAGETGFSVQSRLFTQRDSEGAPGPQGEGQGGGRGVVHPTKHTALCFENWLYPQALGLESEAPSPSALPPPRCHLLRGFHVEASLSKFAKCLFTPVRWGFGEAVNAKMAPARGLKGTFWGSPNGAAASDPGRPEASRERPHPAPPSLPPDAARGPLLIIPAAGDPFRG